jgi:hypothetical protein
VNIWRKKPGFLSEFSLFNSASALWRSRGGSSDWCTHNLINARTFEEELAELEELIEETIVYEETSKSTASASIKIMLGFSMIKTYAGRVMKLAQGWQNTLPVAEVESERDSLYAIMWLDAEQEMMWVRAILQLRSINSAGGAKYCH